MEKKQHIKEMTDYYEDWKKETISFMGNLNKFEPLMAKGTRGSLGMDTSREYYEYLRKVHDELITSGAIKDQCISCKSIDTTYNKPNWICNKCGQTWDPERLRYKGI